MRQAALLVALAATLVVGCRRDDDAVRYVGSDACRPCHAAAVDAWASSDHHAAMLPATAGRAPRGAPGPLRDDGGALAFAGPSLDWPTDVRAEWALGRKHVEQYVGTVKPGRLQAVPLAWDVVAREWFDLFEGEGRRPEERGHWTNRALDANAECFFCHTTDYEKGYRPATDDYESRWTEIGVGCEACHGPGAAHVRAPGDPRRDPYVGSAGALGDACAACHARRVERGPWVPGDAFLEAFAPDLLDGDVYHPDGQLKEESYEAVSFGLSVMQARGVGCWNCHDAHRGGTVRAGNALCLGCHAPRYGTAAHTHHPDASPGAACVACHMPTTVFMRRDPRHDHSFPRPDPEATRALGVPNPCNGCHADRDADWAADRVRAWFPDGAERTRRRGVATAIAQGRAGDAAAVPALVDLVRSDADAIRRASAARLLAGFPTAAGVTDTLLRALRDRQPLVRAGAVWAFGQRQGLDATVRAALVTTTLDPVRAVRLEAAAALLPDTDVQQDPRVVAATDEFRDAEAWRADTPEAHHNLALVARARGRVDAAIAEYREALRLWPRATQSRHDLALLLAGQGRAAEAEAELRTLLDVDPTPEAALSLGLLYGEQQRWSDAVAALERGYALEPQYPRLHYNLGLAYAKTGDATRAFAALEEATGDPAASRDAVKALVDLARATKNREKLEQWLPEAVRIGVVAAEPATVTHER